MASRALFLVCALAMAACGESAEESPASGGAAGQAGSGGTSGQAGASGSAGQGGQAGQAGAAGQAGSPQLVDADGDGLDDALEQAIAESHFPYLSLAPNDKCPLHGVLFRATPHPDDASRWMIWYVVLFQNDCGANGHVGDDEVFGAVVDPATPAPAGILALRAISHQGTVCESTTECGTLPGCDPCTTAQKNGQAFPVVFPSVNKHGQFVKESTCDASIICDFGGCTQNPTPSTPPLVNAGEPGAPLVNDLTTQGFINSANGWTEAELMGFDPWSNSDFGSAGNVTDDLTDTAFVIPLSGC